MLSLGIHDENEQFMHAQWGLVVSSQISPIPSGQNPCSQNLRQGELNGPGLGCWLTACSQLPTKAGNNVPLRPAGMVLGLHMKCIAGLTTGRCADRATPGPPVSSAVTRNSHMNHATVPWIFSGAPGGRHCISEGQRPKPRSHTASGYPQSPGC